MSGGGVLLENFFSISNKPETEKGFQGARLGKCYVKNLKEKLIKMLSIN